jgi:LPS sulfotransferase NodH
MIYVTNEIGKVDVFSTIAVKIKKRKKGRISKKNYILCITERSGSTMFCSLLQQTNSLGMPDEYLNPRGVMQYYLEQYPVDNIVNYFDLLRRHQASGNRVFGIKTNYIDFEILVKEKLIGNLLEPVKFIYLTRQDILLQAISSYIARQSGKWHSFVDEEDNISSQDICYNEEEIIQITNNLLLERAQWELFFNLHSIKPLRITYEDILADTEGSIRDVAKFIGVRIKTKVNLNMSKTQKLGDLRNQEWADRIRDDRRLLSF